MSLSFSPIKNGKRGSGCKGFTLVELLISISILTLLSMMAFPAFNNLYASTKPEEAAINVEEELLVARNFASSGYNDSDYGLYFDISEIGADRIIRYKGGSYADRIAAADIVTALDESIDITTTFFGNEINFANGTGAPANTGYVDIGYTGTSTGRISINEYGIILSD